MKDSWVNILWGLHKYCFMIDNNKGIRENIYNFLIIEKQKKEQNM